MDDTFIFATWSCVQAESKGRAHSETVFSPVRTDEPLQKSLSW